MTQRQKRFPKMGNATVLADDGAIQLLTMRVSQNGARGATSPAQIPDTSTAQQSEGETAVIADPQVWDFLTALRDVATFRDVRGTHPEFELSEVPSADPAARLLWDMLCFCDRQSVQNGEELEDAALKNLRAIADLNPVATEVIDWICDPKATVYKHAAARKIARQSVLEFQRNTAAGPESATPRPRFIFVSAQEVIDQRPPEEILEGIFYYNTVAEIVAKEESYKTFIALSMMHAIASGLQWQGRATTQMPVAYVSGEGGGAIGKRVRALEIRTGQKCKIQFLREAVQIHNGGEVEMLLMALEALPEMPGVIVIDTLARCFVGGDENSARDAGLFVAGVDRIRAATGAMVLVIHHLNKNGDARGSTAFPGAFDTIIGAKAQNNVVTLECLKQKDADHFERFSLEGRQVELDLKDENGQLLTSKNGAPLTSLVFEQTDTPAATMPPADQKRERVLDILRDAGPDGLTATEWQKRTDLSNGGFYNILRELDGQFTKTGKIYSITPNAPFGVNGARKVTPFTPHTVGMEQMEFAGVEEVEEKTKPKRRAKNSADDEPYRANGHAND